MQESITWIMQTLYGDYDLTVDQYNALLEAVTNLVEYWECKLA